MQDKAIKNLVDTGILEGKRIFTTNKQYSRFLRPCKKQYEFKPDGLWYSIGDAWIDWCLGEQFGGIGKYIYEIELNPKANMLFLDTPEKVFEFSEKYRRTDGIYALFNSVNIDWQKVSQDYDGIEINPYFHELIFSHDLIWYYGWDVPSGCLWRAKAKKKITLLTEHSDKKKEFVRL